MFAISAVCVLRVHFAPLLQVNSIRSQADVFTFMLNAQMLIYVC